MGERDIELHPDDFVKPHIYRSRREKRWLVEPAEPLSSPLNKQAYDYVEERNGRRDRPT